MDPVVEQYEQDQQGIVSQKQNNRPPTLVVEFRDQDRAWSHSASSTIAGLAQDNAMCEVCETVLDKRFLTDENYLGSHLSALEESLRVIPGLSEMIEDIQSRLETFEATKNDRQEELLLSLIHI